MARAPALGRMQTLTVAEVVEAGVRLDGDLFVPHSQLEHPLEAGDPLHVFVYEGRDGGLEATTARPAAQLGGFASMRCVAVTGAGAFMDWGLPKDLYVPPHEQAQRMHEGRDYVVTVCFDRKGERLIGSSHVASHLDYDVSAVRIDDEVSLLVYGRNDAGFQVIVDQQHRGLVHFGDVIGPMRIGIERTGFVRGVRDDNRLDIGLARRGKAGMQDAEATVLAALEAAGGHLPLHDRSKPAEIEHHLGLSKKAFKRGVGRLYKARRITIDDDGIRRAPTDPADPSEVAQP